MELAGAAPPPPPRPPLHLRLQAAMEQGANDRGVVRPFENRPQQNGINRNHGYNDANHPRAPTPPRPRLPRMPTPPPPYHPPIVAQPVGEIGRRRLYSSESSRSPSPQRGRRRDRRNSSSMRTSESEYESESYSDDSRPPYSPLRERSPDSYYSTSPEPPRRRALRDRYDVYDHEERRGRDHRSRSRSPRW